MEGLRPTDLVCSWAPPRPPRLGLAKGGQSHPKSAGYPTNAPRLGSQPASRAGMEEFILIYSDIL